MALPHLPATYTARKTSAPAVAVQRKIKEFDYREQWNQNAGYFQWNTVNADQLKAWESKASFQNRYRVRVGSLARSRG